MAFWMALWLSRRLSLPVLVLVTIQSDPAAPTTSIRSMFAPPWIAATASRARALRDVLHRWGIPCLIYRPTDVAALLKTFVDVYKPHMMVADEFLDVVERDAFKRLALEWKCCVYTFDNDLLTVDVDADCDRAMFDQGPSRVPVRDVQCPLFVRNDPRRVFVDRYFADRFGLPDRGDVDPNAISLMTASSALTSSIAPLESGLSSSTAIIDLFRHIDTSLLSPYRVLITVPKPSRAYFVEYFVRRRSSPPLLTPIAKTMSMCGFQQLLKAATNNVEFDALQSQLRSKQMLLPDQRRRWARLLREQVDDEDAIDWAVQIMESLCPSIQRSCLRSTLMLDMAAGDGDDGP